jgi:hypothetical protein
MTKAVWLFALGGLFLGGTWSLYKQKVPIAATIICGLLAVLAIVAAILWSI